MKRIINYFKNRNKVKFDLSCQVVYVEASSISELCEKVKASETAQGVPATTIVVAIIYISTN